MRGGGRDCILLGGGVGFDRVLMRAQEGDEDGDGGGALLEDRPVAPLGPFEVPRARQILGALVAVVRRLVRSRGVLDRWARAQRSAKTPAAAQPTRIPTIVRKMLRSAMLVRV